MEKIFIQIASYKDPELYATIKDLHDKKSGKYQLNICVIDQNSKNNREDFAEFDNFNYKYVNYKNSKGVCWARSIIQNMYNEEEYTLMIDSHHRFVQNWDEKLINLYKSVEDKNPIITAYLPSYNPTTGEKTDKSWQLNFDRFTPEGVVFMMPGEITTDIKPLIPTQFFSAHFVFTNGNFCKEVPYDPNFYFHGEEISLAVRSWTSGYNLFTPTEIIAWHEYTRKGRVKHWDEHPEWYNKNIKSHDRLRQLLGIDDECRRGIFDKKYDIGKKRTLSEYEEFAGIRFKDRAVKTSIINNEYPPAKGEWLFYQKHCINIPQEMTSKNDDFWCIVFKDEDERDIFRKDAEPDEILHLWESANDGTITIWRDFVSKSIIKKYVVWPHRDGEWQTPVVINL